MKTETIKKIVKIGQILSEISKIFDRCFGHFCEKLSPFTQCYFIFQKWDKVVAKFVFFYIKMPISSKLFEIST